MTRELLSTLEASGIWWPAMRNRISCMANVIQLAYSAFMSNPGVTGRTKSLEAHERDQQFGEKESTDIGKSQWQRNRGNARIHNMSAMRPGLAKIIEAIRISRHFERSETDLHIAGNACCNDYSDTWLSKRVHWLSKGQCTNSSTPYYGCENKVELDSGVAWASLPIMRMTCSIIWMALCELWLGSRHNGGKTYTLLWRLQLSSFQNHMLKSLQWPVCSSFRHISWILSSSCDHLGSGIGRWILILSMRPLILPSMRMPFWSTWRTTTVPNIDECPSLNPKMSRTAITSPL